MMNVLITGASGFIGQNLCIAFNERHLSVMTHSHMDDVLTLASKVRKADIIYHLAGVNRSISVESFAKGNTVFTEDLISVILNENPKVKLVYASSTHTIRNSPYGLSKLAAEKIIMSAADSSNISVYIYRLPGVFGKFCRPNYNSVVATFCHNIIYDLPLKIDNPFHQIELTYIDDVIEIFSQHLTTSIQPSGLYEIPVKYQVTLKELSEIIKGFKQSRKNLEIDAVGKGLNRALYATYLSYLPTELFSYSVPIHKDNRGIFSELIKTPIYGQFSFFTAKPGATRGGHYHHSKNEKFIVMSGEALFKFQHIITNETVEFVINAEEIKIVETIPGWAHSIKNMGSEKLVVLLWANELFDVNKPDTIAWSM